MELILQKLEMVMPILTIYIIVVFIIGICLYLYIRNAKIDKLNLKLHGLLMGFKSYDIFIFSLIVIRTYLIIASVVTYAADVYLYLTMIFIVSFIYIICNIRKALFESISIILQMIVIYLINIIKTYTIEISNDLYVQIVETVLVVFMLIYSLFFFLKNFEDLVEKNKKKRGKKIEKV